MITQTYDLSITPGGILHTIHISQYDANSRILVFNLVDETGTFDLPSGTKAAIRGTKPDGAGFDYEAELSGTTVTFTATEQMAAIAGKVICEVYLFTGTPATTETPASDDFKQLASANFIIKVERAALDKDTLDSESELRQFSDVIDRMDEIIAAADAVDSKLTIIEQKVAESVAAKEDAEDAAESAAASYASTDERAQQLQRMTTNAEEIAAEALSVTTGFDNDMATLQSKMRDVETMLNNVSIDPDDLGLEQDPDTYYVYPTYKGVRSENGIPLSAGGGGGGGGGDIISAVLTVENTSGFLSKTIPDGGDCNVSFTWSSIENEMPTGDGTMRITVNEQVKASISIQQGNVLLNLKPYLSAGTNKVKVRISDTYDQGKTTTFTITSVALSISSTFDASTQYSSTISFPYTPIGTVDKTVKFFVDGTLIGTQATSVSNRQMSFAIPAQSHGGHSLRVYFEAEINGETVRSNELYYEFIFVDPLSNQTIITSNYNATHVRQYSTFTIPYQVYNPASLTADVVISVNGTAMPSVTVDRTQQAFTYRADNTGALSITIASGGVTKSFALTVDESDVEVEAVTDNLALYLSAFGRSNTEEHPEVWEDSDNNISATLTDFNFTSDGWQQDEQGITCLRVGGDARVTIPYKIFQDDFRTTGKTIELEFATRDVMDYDAPILSCYANGRGIKVTPQLAWLDSQQSHMEAWYKENEHVRISFVVEKRAGSRILFCYINGIISGGLQYPTDDDFTQGNNAVNISIGSNDSTIDVYNIRVYDNDLNDQQMLENWIADTQDIDDLVERYTRNNILENGNIVISKLPSDLPYMIITCPVTPQYKGDKKTCTIQYIDPLYPSLSFTAENVQIDVQGTSSQYYPRKNYKIKCKGGFVNTQGVQSAKYQLTPDTLPTTVFCLKADFASCEGANNVELVRAYCKASPYRTPAERSNPLVRQGIDGKPIVIFHNDGNSTTFIGKYNFNLDKGAEECFGFVDGDESWEVKTHASDRVLWKISDFTSMGVDDKGNPIPAWLNDFEARYPDEDPAYTDYTKLKWFSDWICQTDTDAATGNALAEPVTYAGVEYTNDTAAYRLAKFKAEIGNYVEVDSMLFYYLFTELFLMADSRSKNMFPSFMGSEVSA